MIITKKNYIGMTFGRITVLEQVEDHITSSGKHITKLKCQCECGAVKEICAFQLMRGDIKSCGKCNRNRNNNQYIIHDDYAELITNVGDRFLIDKEDIDRLKKYTWGISKGYGATTINRKSLKMHRFIMNCPDGFIVDHINHNKLDNRKCNLRICTIEQNNMNTQKYKNNTSGAKGVVWDKKSNKWQARISFHKKRIILGMFEKKEDAIKARQQAEKEMFGEYSYERSINNDNISI